MTILPLRVSSKDFAAACAAAKERKAKRLEKSKTLWPRKTKKLKSKTTAQIEAILWEVFSIYIRLRDKIANHGLCFYCEKRPIRCAMHRIKRGKRATKYDERNVHGGCNSCNFEDQHNPQKFDAIFIRKKGAPLFLELETLSREECERSRVDIVEKTEFYREKTRTLLADMARVKNNP